MVVTRLEPTGVGKTEFYKKVVISREPGRAKVWREREIFCRIQGAMHIVEDFSLVPRIEMTIFWSSQHLWAGAERRLGSNINHHKKGPIIINYEAFCVTENSVLLIL